MCTTTVKKEIEIRNNVNSLNLVTNKWCVCVRERDFISGLVIILLIIAAVATGSMWKGQKSEVKKHFYNWKLIEMISTAESLPSMAHHHRPIMAT